MNFALFEIVMIYTHYVKNIRKGENVEWISKLYVLKTEDFSFFLYKLLFKYIFSKTFFAWSTLKLKLKLK